MKSKSLSQMAAMNVDEGEEIAGVWSSPHIPQVGFYRVGLRQVACQEEKGWLI